MTKKILIADDEPGIVKLMEATLSQRGHTIFKAVNGKEALDLAFQKSPDLIILDVHMPKLNGFEVLERLKKEKKTQNIPVVMLTVEQSEEGIQRGMEMYAHTYLPKPFQMNELVQKIEKILQ